MTAFSCCSGISGFLESTHKPRATPALFPFSHSVPQPPIGHRRHFPKSSKWSAPHFECGEAFAGWPPLITAQSYAPSEDEEPTAMTQYGP